MNGKTRTDKQRNRNYKEESNRNYRTKTTTTLIWQNNLLDKVNNKIEIRKMLMKNRRKRVKEKFKVKRNLGDLISNIKWSNIYVIRVTKTKKRE